MRTVMEGGDLQVESGLLGQLHSEINRYNKELEHILLKPLDRISLLLCRQGFSNRALSVLEEVKLKYPAVVELSGAIPILKRIDKALGKSPLVR